MIIPPINIDGCAPVPVKSNPDSRGSLLEIFREEWPGAFKTVQWNACRSPAGVMRGVHVHVDYDEFYTLPFGRVFLALKDIRGSSPTFGNSAGFVWSASDDFAMPVPAGVAHAVFFMEDSLLALGLSCYWRAELDGLGCRWNELDPSIKWPVATAMLSDRDDTSGSYAEMVAGYEAMTRADRRAGVLAR